MHRRALLLVICLVSLLSSVAAHAQVSTNPLIILMQGNLWAWNESNGTMRQLTTTGYIARPVISPDGRRVAYTAINEMGVRVLESGFVGDGPMPNDVWIMETATGRATRIAAQPPGASFTTAPVNFVFRSSPSWSAGGNTIAWSELALPDFTHRIMLYDLTTNLTTIVTNLPEPAASPGPATVRWVGDWLAVQTSLYSSSADTISDAILTFTVTGTALADVRLSNTVSGNDYVIDMFEVMQELQPYVGLIYASGLWQLIDPVTGNTQILSARPEQYSLLAPETSALLQFFPGIDAGGQRVFSWLFVDASRQITQLLPYDGFPDGIALSPDGQSLVYIGPDALYVWRGQAHRIAGTEQVASGYSTIVWGPTGLRVPSIDQGGGLAITCPGFMPSRLFAGGLGRVTPGDPNNIRTAPGYANASMGLIPGGDTFTIISGPVCADNTAWWRVSHGGRDGWVAEGSRNIYWLEPTTIVPTPFVIPTTQPTCTMTPRLAVGTSAEVTFGPSNNLRASPGFSGAITGQLEGGRIVSVFSGPQCIDGIQWWEVGEPFAFAGWTAEGQNGEYWLVPVVCPNGMYSRLAPNRTARVTPGAPNNLRDQPLSGGVSSTIIGQIPAGASVTVLSGPRCGSDGLMYWQVNYGGLVGWTAEGDAGVYWLESGF